MERALARDVLSFSSLSSVMMVQFGLLAVKIISDTGLIVG